jgi:hypothetical protein
MAADELQREIDRLAQAVENKTDELSMLESKLARKAGQGALVADDIAGQGGHARFALRAP